MNDLKESDSKLYEQLMLKKVEAEVWGVHKDHQKKLHWTMMPCEL